MVWGPRASGMIRVWVWVLGMASRWRCVACPSHWPASVQEGTGHPWNGENWDTQGGGSQHVGRKAALRLRGRLNGKK